MINPRGSSVVDRPASSGGANRFVRRSAFTRHLRVALISLLPVTTVAADPVPAIEAMLDVLNFSEYQGGNISPEQIPRKDWSKFYLVDTRRPVDFARGHIPGATNIEWRQVLERRAVLPRNRRVLLYCDTGSLSAQAAFALKVMGFEDVLILRGGYRAWKAKGGLDAYRHATGSAAAE